MQIDQSNFIKYIKKQRDEKINENDERRLFLKVEHP